MTARLMTSLLLLIAGSAAIAAAATADRPTGYLAPGAFDVTPVIEPAPRPGDPRYETDRQIFRATRRLAGSARWQRAIADADYSTPAMLRDYSCAVGVKLTPANAGKLIHVIERAGADTAGQTAKAKDHYQRNRPFTIDPGPTCQPPSALYDEKNHHMSYDYPSGHATWGWTWALILSGIAPDRARQILQRGRAFADSRFVCGAHNESAVEGGLVSASATMAVVEAKPEYQADRDAARAELTALRASGARPSGCAAEAALTAQRVMPSLDPR